MTIYRKLTGGVGDGTSKPYDGPRHRENPSPYSFYALDPDPVNPQHIMQASLYKYTHTTTDGDDYTWHYECFDVVTANDAIRWMVDHVDHGESKW